MININHLQRTAMLLILLVTGWAAGCPVSAQDWEGIEISPDPKSNLVGTPTDTGIQPLEYMGLEEYGLSFTFALGTGINEPAYYESSADIRLYSGNTFTMETGDVMVSGISFVSDYPRSSESTLSADCGEVSFDAETKTYTWTNTDGVRSVVFTVNDTQLRISSMLVMFGSQIPSETRPKAPVLSQRSCDFYSPFELTITDLNEPAATIRYTLDGTDPSADNGIVYTGPFTIESGADVTVKAVAVTSNGTSSIASATYHYIAKYKFSVSVTNLNGFDGLWYSSDSDYGEMAGEGSGYITEGENVYVYFYLKTGYECRGLTLGGSPVVMDSSNQMAFVMPASDTELAIDIIFNPASPSDPQPGESVKRYSLSLVSNPVGSGSTRGSGEYQAGETVYLYTSPATGYVFSGWTMGGETISTARNTTFVMPASDVVLTAEYVYNPSSPSDPEQPALKHPLTAVASPAGAARFNLSATEVVFGEDYYVYAYPNTGYRLKGWIVNGVAQDETASPLRGVMTDAGAQVVGLFVFDPASPSNPGSNYYNPATGQAIIDDFSSGDLYGAIRDVIGYDNFTNVNSIIVKGRMSSSDYSVFGNLSNASTIDLSRAGGEGEVPSYTFQNLSAAHILLPYMTTSIGNNAFSGCENLTSLTVYAMEPPKCYSNTFSGFTNKDNCTVYVPASAIELYSDADYWKDFTILPITDDAHVLQVTLPADASDGKYKNNSIEIVNLNSGVRQKYVVSDRLLYTFNGLRKDEQYNVYMYSQAGLEIGRIENVVIPDRDSEVTFDKLRSLHTVLAEVIGAQGEDVTEKVTVEWLKPLADGTSTYLRKTASLGEIPEGQQLICRVTLDNTLGGAYANPEDVEFTVSDDNNICRIALTPFRTIALSGSIADSENAPLAGASVSLNQTLNGKYYKNYTTKTDLKGVWNLDVLDAPETRVTYAAAEYVNVNDTIGKFDANISALDLGQTVLRSIVGARVSYGFTYHAAGSEDVESYYPDYQNVAISVFNETQNRAHGEVSLQYPTLVVLDENINEGDRLKLTATSKTGAFNPIEQTVTIDANQRADVTFDIIGKGSIAASFETTDNPAVIAMLYSGKGELLKKTTYSEAKVTFTELEDGDYTLVSMGQSDLMNSILRLSNFAEIGLTEGKDYVKNAVKVETGILTEVRIKEVPAFDESLFYYTGSATGFTSNKSSITTGNYLTLRSVIDFKGVYRNDISNVALVVDLPESCDFVEQSVIQGPNLLPYVYDGNRLTVQLGDSYQSQTRFCVIPTVGGQFTATASIVFDYNGKTLTQPIGAAGAEVKDIEIIVPSSSATGQFRVSGKSEAKAAVDVYVDGVLNAQTIANASGDWNAQCSMDDSDNFSEHYVYAKFEKEGRPVLVSETKRIVYNPYDINVNNVEMTFWNNYYKKQYSVVWNFINGTANCSKYDFYTTTDMTFLIDINYHDIKLIPFVWLHVYTSDSKVRSLRADYDESKNRWVAVDEFSSSALPTRVAVTIENMMFDPSAEVTYETLLDDYAGTIELKDVVEEDGTTTATFTDQNGDDIAEISSYESDKTVDELIDEYKQQGFEEDELIDDESDYEPEDDEDVVEEDVKVLTEPTSGSIVMIGTGLKPKVVVIRVIREENKQSTTELVSSLITREWRSFFRTYFDKVACAQVTEYKKYSEHLEKYVTIITSSLVAHTVYIDVKNLPPGITRIPAKQVVAKLRRIRHSSKRYTTWTMEYSVVPKDCRPPKPPTPPATPAPDVNPILDPSGYVYEAVPENRVEGVQATIYYKETKEDMYGDPYEEVVLWNAEEYAQKNPLFTDENGMYQWDVPQGLWQVKFEKDGYVTAYSEWLPVPPPQLEVNIGIAQNKQPEVTEARAYEEGVEVQFDKYMDPSTLNASNIYVTANGEKLTGEVRMVDSALADEYADEEDENALRYASRVRFVPEQALSATTGEVRVTVSRNVLSYAGIPMTETFSQALDVEKEVQEIVADDVKVLYGGEKEVTVYALPFDAAVGRTLRIANSSDLIATTDISEATLDEEGKAVVRVKGDLPGRSQLTFTIDGVTATGECAVDVVTEIITAEAPKSSRASGTAVYRGTKVELTTDSKNATIWFTTDGSCPCDENGTRRKYTVPIVINDDTKILAITSVGTGEDDMSETAEFNYTLKRSDMDFQLAEGWTWMSHNLESSVAPADLASDEGILRVLSQTQEVIRDPQLGLVGTLDGLNASESYKVQTTAATARKRLSDVAWNPATPIALRSGWNWLGYPVAQTMSVDEAFAPTDAETLDMVVGQNGFAQFDGESWIGTLEIMSPGSGYMYRSESAKNVVYNTSIVSTASSKYAPGISDNIPLALDIHKYGQIMPVVATLTNPDGAQLDNEEYQVSAFCGTECRGIGRIVRGLVMMNVYGDANDRITFSVTDADGELIFGNDVSLDFGEKAVGNIFEPLTIAINSESGVADVGYDGTVKVSVEGDMLRIKGIPADNISLVEVYDTDGRKMIRETRVPESGIRISNLAGGVYVVIVKGNGEYTYHKIAVR